MEDRIISFLKSLREKIIAKFESYETNRCFEREPWEHSTGGGGEIGLLYGNIFEKAAVNFSAVSGPEFPMQDGVGPFFATGLSLITHMKNPKAPTVHMNIRYIRTEHKTWFGGGFDLTPMGFIYEEDVNHFHSQAKACLIPFGENLYPQFSQTAKEYFYIPHRKKERGVGGIFFDHYATNNFENDFAMWQSVGNGFLSTICPILDRRIHLSYDDEDKQKQLEMRAHYVEFNLLYDRGTKFGFASGGNPKAILCSLPPTAIWRN